MRVLINSRLKGKVLSWFHSKPEYIECGESLRWKRWNECSTIVPAKWLWKKNSNDEHGKSESRSMNTTTTKLSWRIISRWTRLPTISWREYPMYDYAIKRGYVSKMPPILKRRSRISRWRTTRRVSGIPLAPLTKSRRRKDGSKWAKRIGEQSNKRESYTIFVGSKPYIVSVTYTAPNNEGNIQPFSCVAIVDTKAPISLIKSDYASINCRYLVTNDFRFNGLNNSRIKILGIFERCVKINNIDVNIKFFVVPDETMSDFALLERDFTSN